MRVRACVCACACVCVCVCVRARAWRASGRYKKREGCMVRAFVRFWPDTKSGGGGVSTVLSLAEEGEEPYTCMKVGTATPNPHMCVRSLNNLTETLLQQGWIQDF